MAEKTKICFYSWNKLTDVFVELACLMQSQNFEIVHAYYGEREHEKIQQKYNGTLYCLQQSLKENWHTQPESDFSHYEREYDLPPLMQLVYADRHIREYSDMATIKRFVLLHIKFWENFFRAENPEYLISEPISGLSLYIAYLIGRKYGCTYLGITHARIPGKFYISEDEYGYCKKLNNLYLKNRDKVDVAIAKKFTEEFIRNKIKPSYMVIQSQPPKLGRIRRFKAYVKIDNEMDYFYTNGNMNLLNIAFEKLSQRVRYTYLRFFQSVFFEYPKDEEYILFPIHFQPEASTMVQTPFFENQVALIENIAKALPIGCMLYVKDHYAVLGSKHLNFYRRMKKLPNVRLINPYVDSHSLIQGAKVVMTITGTVGWEAIIYNKPVIVFGNVFYDVYDNVNKITDLTLLPQLLRKIFLQQTCSDRQLKNIFVGAYIQSLYNGEFDVENLAITNSCINLRNIVAGIQLYIKDRKEL